MGTPIHHQQQMQPIPMSLRDSEDLYHRSCYFGIRRVSCHPVTPKQTLPTSVHCEGPALEGHEIPGGAPVRMSSPVVESNGTGYS